MEQSKSHQASHSTHLEHHRQTYDLNAFWIGVHRWTKLRYHKEHFCRADHAWYCMHYDIDRVKC